MNIKRSYINDQPPIQSVQMVCSKILIADIKWSWTAFDGLICFRINVFFKRNQKSNIILYYVTYKCYDMARERVLDMDLNAILWIVVASLLHMYSASVSFSLSLYLTPIQCACDPYVVFQCNHSHNANKYTVWSNRGENYITFNMTHSILYAQYKTIMENGCTAKRRICMCVNVYVLRVKCKTKDRILRAQ